MLNWIVWNRTDYLHKMDNLLSLICYKTQPTNHLSHSTVSNISRYKKKKRSWLYFYASALVSFFAVYNNYIKMTEVIFFKNIREIWKLL